MLVTAIGKTIASPKRATLQSLKPVNMLSNMGKEGKLIDKDYSLAGFKIYPDVVVQACNPNTLGG